MALRLAGLDNTHAHDALYSTEELKLLLRTNRPDGQLSHDEWHVLAQTLDFSEREVSDLMRPIHEIAAFHGSASWEETCRRYGTIAFRVISISMASKRSA